MSIILSAVWSGAWLLLCDWPPLPCAVMPPTALLHHVFLYVDAVHPNGPLQKQLNLTC